MLEKVRAGGYNVKEWMDGSNCPFSFSFLSFRQDSSFISVHESPLSLPPLSLFQCTKSRQLSVDFIRTLRYTISIVIILFTFLLPVPRLDLAAELTSQI